MLIFRRFFFLICFLIFAQNIDCGFIEAVLTSTHNLCFRAKIRKNVHVYSCKPQFYYIKVGVMGYTLHGFVIMMTNIEIDFVILVSIFTNFYRPVSDYVSLLSLVRSYRPHVHKAERIFLRHETKACTFS